MRTLVTGGAGFIGSELVRHLVLDKGDEVLNVDKITYAGNLASLAAVSGQGNYRFLKADICDAPLMRLAFQDFRPDRVIHLAAESHVDRSISGSRAFIETNVMGTFVLLEQARSYWSSLSGAEQEAFRFLHVSTDEVYGSLGSDGLFDETTPYDPSSPYSASKAASDHLVAAWGRTYGLPVLVSNCSNNYGPHQHPEKLIPSIIVKASRGAPLPVYGTGGNIRDWLHVSDHVRALDLISRKGRAGSTYNVGGRNERRNIDVVNRICAIMDELRPASGPHADLIRFVADRPGHDFRYAIDASKLEAELGWQAAYDFDSGIRATVHWYLENEAWWGPLVADNTFAETAQKAYAS